MKTIERRLFAILLGVGLLALVFGAVAMTANASTEPQGQAVAPSTEWGGCTYWVRRGDNLFRIGMMYGVSPYYLAQMNGLWNPNYIWAGMKLIVPCSGKPEFPRPPKPPPCQTGMTYVVRPGDNLYRIALNHGSTVTAIRDANNLWGKVLFAGTKLVIPCPLPEKEVLPTGPAAPPPGQNDQQPIPPPSAAPEMTPMPTAQNGAATPDPAQTQMTPAPGDTAPLAPEPSASILIGDTVDPAMLELKAGEAVVFVNNTQATITIQSGLQGQPNDLFTSGPLAAGGTWVHLFDTIGSYSYFVTEAPALTGEILVGP